MAKVKSKAPKEKIKNRNDIDSDLTGNGTYRGSLPSIVGKHRILIRGKADYVYAGEDQIEAIKARYGQDFIRDLGEVKSDTRPSPKLRSISYLV